MYRIDTVGYFDFEGNNEGHIRGRGGTVMWCTWSRHSLIQRESRVSGLEDARVELSVCSVQQFKVIHTLPDCWVLAHDDCKESERITLEMVELEVREEKKKAEILAHTFWIYRKRRAGRRRGVSGGEEVVAVGRGPRHMTIPPFATALG